MAERVGVRGSFGAEGLDRMGYGDAASRTAINTEKTAKNTERMIGLLAQLGMTFG